MLVHTCKTRFSCAYESYTYQTHEWTANANSIGNNKNFECVTTLHTLWKYSTFTPKP